LFLLRFVCGARVLAAHLDHGMRANSGADAQWVAGLCRAWAIPLVTARCREAPHGEDAARRERYAFLQSAARVVQADRVVLGHHADDQAETVLFLWDLVCSHGRSSHSGGATLPATPGQDSSAGATTRATGSLATHATASGWI
jgi:tRNA(Ile)-lysidine synthase TilS/MesJ